MPTGRIAGGQRSRLGDGPEFFGETLDRSAPGEVLALERLSRIQAMVHYQLKGVTMPLDFGLRTGLNTIGRNPTNDFCIHEASVSSFHAELTVLEDGSGVLVRDLQSTNGTFVDGQPVEEAHLQPGQALQLGSIELRLEARQISIVVLSAEMLANEIAVSEEDIKQAFDARHGQYDRPERRQIRQVVLTDEARAREVAQLWQAGAAWEAVEAAATAAGGQAMALPMGDKASLPIPALADAAFAAAPQSVTDPVQSPFGWHVIGVEAVEPAQIFTLDQLRDQLRRDVAKDRALDLAYERGNKVEDALAGGMTLAEAAPRFGLALMSATLDPSGRSPANEAVALPVAADQRNAVLRAIFAQDQGAAPRLQEFGDAFAAIEISGVTPPQLRPFAEVEQELRRAVMADARRRFTETRAAGLLAAQRGGKTLVEAAQELGLISTRTAPFGRDPAQGSPVPPELLPPLFEAKRGEATMAEIRGGFAVASVAEILRLDPTSDPLGMGRVRVEIEQAVGDDLEQQFQAALRVRANVRINERVLEQVTR